jgi:hypothetical protein
MAKIEENTTVAKVLEKKGAAEVLTKHQFPCLGCPMAQMEMNTLKLGQVCDMYGIDKKKLMGDLNKLK